MAGEDEGSPIRVSSLRAELFLSASASALAPSSPMLLSARVPDTHFKHTRTAASVQVGRPREGAQVASGSRQAACKGHAEGVEGGAAPRHWMAGRDEGSLSRPSSWRAELFLSASASALAPSSPMRLAARAPDTHTHTHAHAQPHQCKSGGRERGSPG